MAEINKNVFCLYLTFKRCDNDVSILNFCAFQGFFVALKLVALAQSSKELSTANLTMACPPPKLVSFKFMDTVIVEES